MPYKDPEQRRQAARKWRLAHRGQRAAYMRRYRRARSTGRAPGRPRSRRILDPATALEIAARSSAPSSPRGSDTSVPGSDPGGPALSGEERPGRRDDLPPTAAAWAAVDLGFAGPPAPPETA